MHPSVRSHGRSPMGQITTAIDDGSPNRTWWIIAMAKLVIQGISATLMFPASPKFQQAAYTHDCIESIRLPHILEILAGWQVLRS